MDTVQNQVDDLVVKLSSHLNGLEQIVVVSAVTQFAAAVMQSAVLHPGITRKQQLDLFARQVSELVAVMDEIVGEPGDCLCSDHDADTPRSH